MNISSLNSSLIPFKNTIGKNTAVATSTTQAETANANSTAVEVPQDTLSLSAQAQVLTTQTDSPNPNIQQNISNPQQAQFLSQQIANYMQSNPEQALKSYTHQQVTATKTYDLLTQN
jgi:Fe-S cluster biosynthesis and repair protein YggX